MAADVGDTIMFTVPRGMIGKLLEGGVALDTPEGKFGLNIMEIEPSIDEDTKEPDLTVTAIITYIGEVTGEEEIVG